MWIIFLFLIPAYFNDTNLDSFSWLVGSWEMKKKNGTSRLEMWNKYDQNTLKGDGLKVSGTDTTLLEHIELAFIDNDIWYIPTVPDQNNAMPVKFKLVSQDSPTYIFENPQHDFPQRIVYEYQPLSMHASQAGDKLSVIVEKMDGTDSIPFQFVRK